MSSPEIRHAIVRPSASSAPQDETKVVYLHELVMTVTLVTAMTLVIAVTLVTTVTP